MPETGKKKISKEFSLDIVWWKHYLHIFNGVAMVPDWVWSSTDEFIQTDACLKGCGVI